MTYEEAASQWRHMKATETDPERLKAARETLSKARSEHRRRYTPPNGYGDAVAHPRTIVVSWR